MFGLVDIRRPWPLYMRLKNSFSPSQHPVVSFLMLIYVFLFFVRKACALFQLDVFTFEKIFFGQNTKQTLW